MLTKKRYMQAYLQGLATGKYWPRALGPVLLVIGSYVPIDKFAAWREWLFWIGAFWLVWVTFWFPYDLLKAELETRDADEQLKSPEARLDRTYHEISRLIEEGEDRLKDNCMAEGIQRWDERVQEVLVRRCHKECLQVYLGNTRPHNQPHLENLEKAMTQLRKLLRQIPTYSK